VPQVIGKGGVNIRKIMDLCGVSVLPEPRNPNPEKQKNRHQKHET
jgi:hypothetical protein